MLPHVNPKQMEQMMHKLGVKQENIDASEVIIKCKDKQIRVLNPNVSKINLMGQESLQITGKFVEEELQSFSTEDIKIIMEQTNCSEKEAKEALNKTGDLAEAIIMLKKE